MRSEAHWLPRWNGTWINQVMACSPAAEPCVRRCKAYLASQLFCKLGWRGCGNSGTGLYQLAEVCGRCTKRSGLITTKHAHVSSATRDVCRKKKTRKAVFCFVVSPEAWPVVFQNVGRMCQVCKSKQNKNSSKSASVTWEKSSIGSCSWSTKAFLRYPAYRSFCRGPFPPPLKNDDFELKQFSSLVRTWY